MPPRSPPALVFPPRHSYRSYTHLDHKQAGTTTDKARQDLQAPNTATHHPSSHTSTTVSDSSPRKRAKFNISTDKLGKLIQHSLTAYYASASWSAFVHRFRGPSHISTGVQHLQHPAAAILESYRTQGVPVLIDEPPWSSSQLTDKLGRGSHKSAHDAIEFVRDELADFAEKGFWAILPFDLVRDLPGLRLSPLGSVPQNDRRPRLIVDLSFYGVNAATQHLAPKEAMQFGRALHRLLYRVRHSNPTFGPVYSNKVDIADGFYRVGIAADGTPALAVVVPSYPGEAPLVGIPLALPMGWVESPPAFCVATETVADLANSRMHRMYAPPHRLEQLANTSVPPPLASGLLVAPARTAHDPLPLPRTTRASNMPLTQPLAYTDVYVDDFCNLVQGNPQRRKMVKRILLHAIDEVLEPLQPFRSGAHTEPISVKKLLKGDATWSTQKVILGWLLDTATQTLQLPERRYQRLQAIFDELRDRKRCSVRKWQQYLGELRSMVIAIPGGRGLFSTLQHGLRHSDKCRIRIDADMRSYLTDFEYLAQDLHARPTHLAELVPERATAIGSHDASALGMGGVWFVEDAPPIVWRHTFPEAIRNKLVSWSNPTGSITNSDLELCGTIAHQDVLAQHVDVRHATIGLLGDNTPAIVWLQKGSTTTNRAASALLRLASLHQRHHRYLATYDHIAGSSNVMADDASRLFHLTDTQFLACFNQVYPQPLPWVLQPLRRTMHSALTSALLLKPVDTASVLNEPPLRITPGTFGRISAVPKGSTPYWKASPIRSHTSKSSPNDIVMVDLPRMVSPSTLAPWRTPSAQWARSWPAWGPLTSV